MLLLSLGLKKEPDMVDVLLATVAALGAFAFWQLHKFNMKLMQLEHEIAMMRVHLFNKGER